VRHVHRGLVTAEGTDWTAFASDMPVHNAAGSKWPEGSPSKKPSQKAESPQKQRKFAGPAPSPMVNRRGPSPLRRSGGAPKGDGGPVGDSAVLLGSLAAHTGRVNKLLACKGSKSSFLSCGSDQLVVLWRTGVVEWERRNEASRLAITQQSM
jgi:hypothetical protein